MKKLVFFFLFSILSCGLFAQITFSPFVAANLAKARTNRSEFNTTNAFRYTFGIQPVYHFNEKMAVGLGIQMSTKGYKDNDGMYRLGEEADFQYFEANPFFEYRPFKFLGIIAGGNAGYLNSVKYKYNGKWQQPVSGFIYPQKWDIQVMGGLRYYLGDAFVSLLFSQSILPFEKINFTDENGNADFTLKEYHQSLSLGVGYNFHLKKK